MSDQVLYPDVTVPLVNRDGNAFAIIATVADAIRDVHGPNRAAAYEAAAWLCTSYDELLALTQRTVTVC